MRKIDEKKFFRRNEKDYNRKTFSRFFEDLDPSVINPYK